MSDVTLTVGAPAEGAAAELIRDAKAPFTITDSKGRSIVLRKPGVLAQYRMVEMLGDKAASNQAYMNMILPLMYVESIDGNPAAVGNKIQLEALITILDEDGIADVMQAINERFGVADPEADKQALKG